MEKSQASASGKNESARGDAPGNAYLRGENFREGKPYSEEKANASTNPRSGSGASRQKREDRGTDEVEVNATQSRAWKGWLSGVGKRAEHFERGVQAFVKERPLVVLMGAVALGFVVDRLSQMTEETAQ